MGMHLFIANPLPLGPSNPVFFVIAMSYELTALSVIEERLPCGGKLQFPGREGDNPLHLDG
jgi:hypothetical protein